MSPGILSRGALPGARRRLKNFLSKTSARIIRICSAVLLFGRLSRAGKNGGDENVRSSSRYRRRPEGGTGEDKQEGCRGGGSAKDCGSTEG